MDAKFFCGYDVATMKNIKISSQLKKALVYSLLTLFTLPRCGNSYAAANSSWDFIPQEQSIKHDSFLSILNAYRAQNGAGPLQISQSLTRAAQWMSEDMSAKNYFDHTDSIGRLFNIRISSFGYRFPVVAENIAWGTDDAQTVFTRWKNSPGHNVNMLNPQYKVIGIGTAPARVGLYWTTDFGAKTE